jgi:hypothetical protein
LREPFTNVLENTPKGNSVVSEAAAVMGGEGEEEEGGWVLTSVGMVIEVGGVASLSASDGNAEQLM